MLDVLTAYATRFSNMIEHYSPTQNAISTVLSNVSMNGVLTFYDDLRSQDSPQ